MDEWDTKAEKLVDMFPNKDELCANIGEKLREAVTTAYEDAIHIIELMKEAELVTARSPLLYDDQKEEHRIAARALDSASSHLLERLNERVK